MVISGRAKARGILGDRVRPQVGRGETLFKNRFQRLSRVAVDFGYCRKEFYVTDYGNRVGMLAVRDGCVLLIREYRLQLRGLSWEIPGGAAESGEHLARAAVRECLEETGVRCLDARPLIVFHPGLDTVHNPTHIFRSSRFRGAAQPVPGEREIVEARWVPLQRCSSMIRSGAICDALSLVALLAFSGQQPSFLGKGKELERRS